MVDQSVFKQCERSYKQEATKQSLAEVQQREECVSPLQSADCDARFG